MTGLKIVRKIKTFLDKLAYGFCFGRNTVVEAIFTDRLPHIFGECHALAGRGLGDWGQNWELLG